MITDNFSSQVLAAILHNINVLNKLSAVCTNSFENNSSVESMCRLGVQILENAISNNMEGKKYQF